MLAFLCEEHCGWAEGAALLYKINCGCCTSFIGDCLAEQRDADQRTAAL
jgi:hypothetical protein